MQDKTSLGISDTFREYIAAIVEEVVINGEPFEAQKKWLRKNSEAEGLSYETIESNLNDLFEAIKELEGHESKFVEHSVRALAKECYLSEALVDKLIDNAATIRRQKEAAERREKEDRERKAQEEQDRMVREKAQWQKKFEAERKAKEEAERLALAAAQAREESERKAREERERRAREEAERKAREAAERKNKASFEISKFFPVYGVILGKTKVYELPPLILSYNSGDQTAYLISSNSRTTLISDCQGLIEAIIARKGNDLPFKWTSLGFNWELSYNQCTSLVQKLGFSIKEIQKPICENPYGNVYFFHAAFEATSHSGMMSIDIGFNAHHEASVDSPNTLEYISIRYLD